MPDWKEREGVPSYKGHALTDMINYSISSGKKGKDTEYANQDGGGAEDLGLRQTNISVNISAGGSDFDIKRNELLRVLESEGAGELILPNHAPVQALATKWGYEGGYTSAAGFSKFNITFVVVTQGVAPDSIISITADDIITENILDFIINLAVESIDAITSAGNVVQGFLDDIQKSVNSSTNPLYIATARSANTITGVLISSNPREVFAGVLAVVDLLSQSGVNITQAIRDTATAWENQISLIDRVVASASKDRGASIAIEALGAIVLTSLAKNMLGIDYTTRDEAVGVVNNYLDYYDLWRETIEGLEEYGEDFTNTKRFIVNTEMIGEVQKTAIETTTQIINTAQNLPGTQTITYNLDTTPLSIAFDIYGDITRVDELIESNQFPDPTLIPAGTEIRYHI